MKLKKWMWAFAAMPLLCLPLIAQEIGKGSALAPAARPAPSAPDATTTQPDAKPRSEPAEAVSQDKPEPPDERISADNNTSFPVDI